MTERRLALPVIDGGTLAADFREALRPGEVVRDRSGVERRLPRWFYEVASREAAEVELAPGFALREFLATDVHEARSLHRYPRYVPCAITLLAAALSVLRQRWGTYVFIAANGGYRSPAHGLNREASLHCWATAANIYRIGDTYLDDRASIERFAADAHEALPWLSVRPYGHDAGFADDHLHLDIGYILAEVEAGPPEDD